jgi:hypothetical protein
MPDTLSLEIKASVNWLFEETLDLSTLTDSSKLEYSQALADGTGSNQADKIWHDTRTLAASANDDLDLTALTQTVHGSTVTISFARLKAIFIYNTATTAGEDLVLDSSVTGGILTPFNGSSASKLEVAAASPLLLANQGEGWAVTASTADILRITNDGVGSIDYKIVLVGTSA